ncbi:SDR family NAD(P)-dependent oxidoreductase [Nocardiopsis sp. N85]|uniref:SDR family NAD(P)-dependent oxidoreductase n=1 Tax=Nocardiopsis sp. N85 TaxID=3029400 RepID=UPI00237F9732|nr:SDR family oxidoreductase [Nocardiopsis sp. N85]MDE3724939.1 SDR family NAD(P)-dependent oxidoreductase [Nocardiopsis sp. N85]
MSRNVLVTGAARGIGRAVAAAFAASGDRVAVHYGTRRAEAEDTLAALPGEGHVLVGADLRDPEAVASLVERAVDGLGGVDVLVNNAAVNVAHPLADTSYEEWRAAWRETMDVNVFGAANVSYLVARHMIDRGVRGRIVNIGSRGAYKGEPDHPAYGAAKAALHSLGQSLAVALAPHGIAVASVAPGFVATERVADRLSDAVLAQSPFGRVATPEEVASAVHHLASPGAVWSSGAVLDLNGASHLR